MRSASGTMLPDRAASISRHLPSTCHAARGHKERGNKHLPSAVSASHLWATAAAIRIWRQVRESCALPRAVCVPLLWLAVVISMAPDLASTNWLQLTTFPGNFHLSLEAASCFTESLERARSHRFTSLSSPTYGLPRARPPATPDPQTELRHTNAQPRAQGWLGKGRGLPGTSLHPWDDRHRGSSGALCPAPGRWALADSWSSIDKPTDTPSLPETRGSHSHRAEGRGIKKEKWGTQALPPN